jgi:hypothetical protein
MIWMLEVRNGLVTEFRYALIYDNKTRGDPGIASAIKMTE